MVTSLRSDIVETFLPSIDSITLDYIQPVQSPSMSRPVSAARNTRVEFSGYFACHEIPSDPDPGAALH